jgi:hypothetical protein
MVLVSPESDPLAGAWTFPSSEGPGAGRDPTPGLVAAPTPEIMRPTPEHLWLRAADWSLALDNGETSATVAPAVALSAALSLSAGPAPHLTRAAYGEVVVSVPEVSVEEGAWEARRR